MKLRKKITLIVILVMTISIANITILSYFQMKKLITEQYSKDLLDVANAISQNYIVKQYLSGDTSISNDKLNIEIEKVRLETSMDFIVVLDMNDIRQTHPTRENIGKRFQGGDENRALLKGEQYVSQAKGSLGVSYRAFVPVYNNSRQVGVVTAGVLSVNFHNLIIEKLKRFIPFIILSLAIGTAGAFLLSLSIKKTIFGMEPEEIALELKQKKTILENIKEGVLLLDKDGKLTFFNKEAGNILDLKEMDIGKDITELVDYSRAPEVLTSGEPMENIEVKARPGVNILSKFNPLKNNKNQVIGLVINFRNLTEITKLAEELTGIKKMAWSLRAQNHEFMNKLHTISGLIQLEEYDSALKFISDISNTRNNISDILNKNIKDVALSALLLSKYNKAEEVRIKLTIDEDSKLTKLPQYMTSQELVSVIGNLIENSLDAVKNDGSGEVHLKVQDDEKRLNIKIKDNGPGIPKEIRDKIYTQGFTTKEGQRGHGMYIVKKIIDEFNGIINLEAENGTEWDIYIPMKRG
ncbi:MAG: malK [Clostridiaceae bacterium]|nr:malK [Clostridiaceae bacterium]